MVTVKDLKYKLQMKLVRGVEKVSRNLLNDAGGEVDEVFEL